MTIGLNRFYGGHDLHFITGSCYRRRPELGTASRRDLFLRLLEEARQRYQFVVYGYVVMPEHFHLLISEPEKGNPSLVMKVIKQRFAQKINRRRRRSSAQMVLWPLERRPLWQKRFYDFNVWSHRKRLESCAISTAIRLSAAWWRSRRIGAGAAFGLIAMARMDRWG